MVKANRFTGSLKKDTLTVADYFSKVAVFHIDFLNEKRHNLNFFTPPDKAFLPARVSADAYGQNFLQSHGTDNF